MRSLAFVSVLLVALPALAADQAVRVKGKKGNVILHPDGSVQVVDGDKTVEVGADGAVKVHGDAGERGDVPAGVDSAGAETVAAGDIADNKTKGTRDCKGGSVRILGNHNTWTFTNCAKVSVLGNHNAVTLGAGAHVLEVSGNHNAARVETLQSASVPGNFNTLVWKNAAAGRAPSISAPGRSNSITRK